MITLKISTKGRYGLKAIVYIGANCQEENVSLKSIAENEGISENYLEQLISSLKKAKLVKSVRGAKGGYTIDKDLKEITVGEILKTLEGSIAFVDCVYDKNDDNCNCGGKCGDKCSTKDVWEKINDTINNVVDNITLYELVENYKQNLRSDNK